MEPENLLEKEIPVGNHDFQVPAVRLWGCMEFVCQFFFQKTSILIIGTLSLKVSTGISMSAPNVLNWCTYLQVNS